MSQVKVINGDLHIIFHKCEDDMLMSYKLNNGAEIDFFYNDDMEYEISQLVLPRFEAQMNRGDLSKIPMELVDTQLTDEKVILSIKILNDTINITLDYSSMQNI